jgi:Ca-activated chloride channel family protein
LLYNWYQEIVFAYPYLLWGLLLIPLMVYWYLLRLRRGRTTLLVSTTKNFMFRSWKFYFRHTPFVCRCLGVALLVIALARPQKLNLEERYLGEGIDIMLCMDVSGSMLAQDFQPNRLEASKEVAASFIDSRLTDRMGLVIFSGESFTQCPLTTDKEVLKNQLFNMRSGFLEDGTAIGSGLATSLDRLRSSDAKTKIVVLLTDGENNKGLIDPSTAREMAKTLGIKVYTIGVGTEGMAPIPIQTPNGIVMQMEKVNINEPVLTRIAEETGGKYFRAKDKASLSGIYQEIDRLEKSTIQASVFKRAEEKFHFLVGMALALLFLEVFLRLVVLRKFP